MKLVEGAGFGAEPMNCDAVRHVIMTTRPDDNLDAYAEVQLHVLRCPECQKWMEETHAQEPSR